MGRPFSSLRRTFTQAYRLKIDLARNSPCFIIIVTDIPGLCEHVKLVLGAAWRLVWLCVFYGCKNITIRNWFLDRREVIAASKTQESEAVTDSNILI